MNAQEPRVTGGKVIFYSHVLAVSPTGSILVLNALGPCMRDDDSIITSMWTCIGDILLSCCCVLSRRPHLAAAGENDIYHKLHPPPH